jgi:hypothetical protein
VWEQFFIYGDATISGNMCWCGTSGSFPEIPLPQENFVGVVEVVHLQNIYSQETCFGVAAVDHLRHYYFIRKQVLLWEQWFNYGVAIISQNMFLYRSTTLYMEALFKGICVCLEAVIYLHNCSYIKKHVLF